MQFARFAITRALLAMFTLILVSLIVFSLMELVPGDSAERANCILLMPVDSY